MFDLVSSTTLIKTNGCTLHQYANTQASVIWLPVVSNKWRKGSWLHQFYCLTKNASVNNWNFLFEHQKKKKKHPTKTTIIHVIESIVMGMIHLEYTFLNNYISKNETRDHVMRVYYVLNWSHQWWWSQCETLKKWRWHEGEALIDLIVQCPMRNTRSGQKDKHSFIATVKTLLETTAGGDSTDFQFIIILGTCSAEIVRATSRSVSHCHDGMSFI